MKATDVKRLSRRELLKLSPVLLLGAFGVPDVANALLEGGVRLSDAASGAIFRERHLAPTFADADVVPFDRFPYNGKGELEPEIDLAGWALDVGGSVGQPGRYTLDQVRRLPKVTQNTRHVCVEGWDVVGAFGGARLADFLAMIGADPGARFVNVTCADGYYESLDIETARQPQSLLCYEMYGQPLDRGHGAPLRLTLPTKLGYKQAKYLMTLDVTYVRPARGGFWSDQGYSWYGGL
jgi:DMSO/TMAO reductase YedYZ molybdopterin-dependent catalytic subunit